MLLVLLNTVFMALDRFPEPGPVETRVSSIANTVFTLIFFIEVCLKLFALNTEQFLCDSFNLIDTFIAVIAMVELALQFGTGSQLIQALRVLRLFRAI